MSIRIAAIIATFAIANSIHVSPAQAFPKIVVGTQVAANEQVSMGKIDHRLWNQLLQKYVNDQGQVNYQDWKASQADSQALDRYINTLATANPSASATREGSGSDQRTAGGSNRR